MDLREQANSMVPGVSGLLAPKPPAPTRKRRATTPTIHLPGMKRTVAQRAVYPGIRFGGSEYVNGTPGGRNNAFDGDQGWAMNGWVFYPNYEWAFGEDPSIAKEPLYGILIRPENQRHGVVLLEGQFILFQNPSKYKIEDKFIKTLTNKLLGFAGLADDSKRAAERASLWKAMDAAIERYWEVFEWDWVAAIPDTRERGDVNGLVFDEITFGQEGVELGTKKLDYGQIKGTF